MVIFCFPMSVTKEEMIALGVTPAKAEQSIKNKNTCALLRGLIDTVCTCAMVGDETRPTRSRGMR